VQHSSLFGPFVSCEENKVFEYGPRPLEGVGVQDPLQFKINDCGRSAIADVDLVNAIGNSINNTCGLCCKTFLRQ
jgi:hypothetical protein